MKRWIRNIWFSFPIQLTVLHFRNGLILTLTWLILLFLINGKIAASLGINYLFLAPEYLGVVNYLSFIFLGFSFGVFFVSWNLTTYLLHAHRFPFLASLNKPFTKFCINNSIIPLAFLLIYLALIIDFQSYYELRRMGDITLNIFSFIGGFIFFLILSAIYFNNTNKDIRHYVKKRKRTPPNIIRNLGPGQRTDYLSSYSIEKASWRVDIFLNEFLKPRLVRSVAHYDLNILIGVFKQNHGNALIAQVFAFVVLISLGYMIDYPFFRIPTGASIFVLFSILIAVAGALFYYFGRWQTTVVFFLLIGLNQVTSLKMFNNISHKNKGYGLNYTNDLATYSKESLKTIASAENIEADKNNTIEILNKWKDKNTTLTGKKPKLIIFTVSGGGLKSAVWAMHVMQQMDSLTNGRMMNATSLTAGASGGMLGISYMRELYLRSQSDSNINLYDKKYLDYVSKDLLNPVAFTIVSNDLFLPWVEFEVNGQKYRKDRGYIFEKQFNENTEGILDKLLMDYELPEKEAKVPLFFITPSIVNDGRRMIISPQGVSYMMNAPSALSSNSDLAIDAVDFGRFFSQQGAKDLQFSSALRMNATYPYILPNVFLPSDPWIEVMDSGFRDNDGTKSATRFIQVFREWMLENTSGVIIVQVRGVVQDQEKNEPQGVIESILNPLGIAGKILKLQEYEHDTNIGLIADLLGPENFNTVRFTYYPTADNEKASMTFHLTTREKNDIIDAFYLEENQKSKDRLIQLLD